MLAERFGWDRKLLCIAQQMDSRKVGAGNRRLRGRDGPWRSRSRGCGPTGEPRSCHGMARRRRAALHRARGHPASAVGQAHLQRGGEPGLRVYDCCFNGIHVPGEAREAMIAAMGEVAAVGRACGIALTDDDVAYWLDIIDHLNPACRACARTCWRAVPPGGALLGAPSTAWARPTASPRPKRALHAAIKELESSFSGRTSVRPRHYVNLTPERGDQGRPPVRAAGPLSKVHRRGYVLVTACFQ